MSNLVLVYDRAFQQHQTPPAHPEAPARVAAIEKALHRRELISELEFLKPRKASNEELSSVHKASYIEQVAGYSEAAKQSNKLIHPYDDTDTWVSPNSYDIAKLAAGAGLVGVDAVLKGSSLSAFVIARPPGHHALEARSYGFCFFNNVAVAARYAQKELGLKRILIVDWDVHHGNGTQDIFYNDPSVCFVSFHEFPLWPPDSGWYTEDGTGEGKGFNINIPLPAGTGDRGYLKAWDEVLKPIAQEYKPELIIISAGYDAHQFDPLGKQQVTTAGYFLLSKRLNEMSKATGAKVVCFLEGGYNTNTLAEGVTTTISVLHASMKDKIDSLKVFGTQYGGDVKMQTGDRGEHLVDARIDDIKRHFGKYWQSLKHKELISRV